MSEEVNKSYLDAEKIHTDANFSPSCETLSSSVKRNVGILCDELDHVSEMLHRTRLELQLVSQENEVLRRILRCPI